MMLVLPPIDSGYTLTFRADVRQAEMLWRQAVADPQSMSISWFSDYGCSRSLNSFFQFINGFGILGENISITFALY